MPYGRRFISKLQNFLFPGRAEQELAREIAAHIALIEDELQRRGMTAEDARLAAKRSFGGVDQAKQLHRDERSFLWLEQAWQDFRFSVRTLVKRPVFTLIAVLTLALGIGANSAIFSVINAVLLRPLPYRDPDRLVRIIENVPASESPTGRAERLTSMDPEDAMELQRQTKTLSSVALYTSKTMVLTGRAEATIVQVGAISASTFSMLGVSPLLGRMFDQEEERAGPGRVVLLSYSAWLKYFSADANILGRSLMLDDTSYSVIGVMPSGFEFPNPDTTFWKPFVLSIAAPGQISVYPAVARLRAGVSLAAGAAEVNAIFRWIRGEGQPDTKASPGPPRMEIVSMRDEQAAVSRPALFVLAVAVGFVLLIACANVANLMLAQTKSRQREIAIRASLGAGCGRLVRQVLTESVVLALLGGAAAVLLTFGATRLLVMQWPGNVNPAASVPRLNHIAIDGSVIAFTMIVSILTGLLFGLAPALRISFTDHTQAMKGTALAFSGWTLFRNHRGRGTLVIAETGMATVLLAGAGLLIHSFVKLSRVDPGFDPGGVLTFQVSSPPGTQREAFNEELITRMQSIPGVQAAGYGELLPLELGSSLIRLLRIPGVAEEAMTAAGRPRTLEVSWDYLRAVGMRLVAGRWFRASDAPGQPQVMMINRAFARRYFGSEDPVGKTVYCLGKAPWEIVGIVDDVRQRGLDSEPKPQFFLEYHQMLHAQLPPWANRERQMWGPHMHFAVRAHEDPTAALSSIRGIIGLLDRNAALNNVARLEDVVSDSIATPRFYAVQLGSLASVAVALAAIGIYGVIAYLTTQRTREIGIRMALGARRHQVLALVLRQGMLPSVSGIVLGIGGAAVLTRYLRGMLFGLTPLDPQTFFAVSGAFLVIAIVACYVPARRATKVDPVVALRND